MDYGLCSMQIKDLRLDNHWDLFMWNESIHADIVYITNMKSFTENEIEMNGYGSVSRE